MYDIARRCPIRVALIALVSVCLAAQPAADAPSARRDAAQASAPQLGSSRNARIAYPMESGPVELTFLARSMSEVALAKLRAAAPNVRVITGVSRDEANAIEGTVLVRVALH